MDHELRKCGVEQAIGVGQRLGPRLPHIHARMARPRRRDEGLGGITAAMCSAPRRLTSSDVRLPMPAADIEDSIAGGDEGEVHELGREPEPTKGRP